jgi:hypothetical protein
MPKEDKAIGATATPPTPTSDPAPDPAPAPSPDPAPLVTKTDPDSDPGLGSTDAPLPEDPAREAPEYTPETVRHEAELARTAMRVYVRDHGDSLSPEDRASYKKMIDGLLPIAHPPHKL